MIVRLPEFTGQPCDMSGAPMERPMGYFARGATGRVCLVMVMEARGDGTEDDVLIEDVEKWARSVPGGYLDY